MLIVYMYAILRLGKGYFLLLSVLLSEALTSFMSFILNGRITYDYLITGGVVSLIVASIVIYLVTQSQRVLFEKDVLQLEINARKQAEELLSKALNESQLLLKELHHRVKNNLQTIASLNNLQQDYTSSPEVISMLRDSMGRVKSMALLHEKIYLQRSLANIYIYDYLVSVVHNLLETFDASDVKFRPKIEEAAISIDGLVPLGLIVNELITNSLKYAFNGNGEKELFLNVTINNNKLLMEIGDSGVGLPDDIDVRNSDTFGFMIVNSLLDQIDGELQHNEHPGTLYNIIIPLS